MDGIKIDSCAGCGRQDMDTVDMLCPDCDRAAGEEGGEVTGATTIVFTDLAGDKWEIESDGDAMVITGSSSKIMMLDRRSAISLRAILDHYIAHGTVPQVVPIPAVPEVVPVTQDQVRDLIRSLSRLGAALRSGEGRVGSLERDLTAARTRIAAAEERIADLDVLAGADGEWRSSVDRRLAVVEAKSSAWDSIRSHEVGFRHHICWDGT